MLITCWDAFLKHPFTFIQLYYKSIEFFFPSFRRLSPDESCTKSLEMSFSLATFKFCTTNHLLIHTTLARSTLIRRQVEVSRSTGVHPTMDQGAKRRRNDVSPTIDAVCPTSFPPYIAKWVLFAYKVTISMISSSVERCKNKKNFKGVFS